MKKQPEPVKSATFLASIPDIKSAFQADADEVRVMLSVPGEYRAEAMKLAGMFGVVLEVAIREH